MKTILVPTDFSKNADNAVDYAVQFAKKEGLKVILLHVYYVTYYGPDFQTDLMYEQNFAIQESTKRNFIELVDRVKKQFEFDCEYIIREGLLIDSILDISEKMKVDLIIMGTQGASGIKEAFIGSNTAKVIGRTVCPLIAVPEKASFGKIENIVFATDYHKSDIKTLNQLVEFAEIDNGTITVIHIIDGECNFICEEGFLKEFEDKVKKKITYEHISYKLIYGLEIEKKLEQYIKKESVNLFGISTKSRNLFKRLFTKSITKKLVYHTKVPFIAFHHK